MTRENFYKLKNKLAEARLLTMQRRNSDSTQNVFGEDNESKSQASSLDSEEPAKGRFMVSWNRRNCNVVQKIVLTYIEQKLL